MAEQIIEFEAMEQAVSLFGSFDENVKLIENEYDVSIISRGSELKVMGDVENVDKAARALRSMLAMINKGESLTEQNVRYVLTLVNEGNEDKIASMSSGSICISSKGRPIKPKTLGQKRYCDAILNNTITFGIGPAGTGKTYLAVAMAVTAFRAKEVDRIILTRLGFNSKMVITGDITQIDLPDGKKSGLKKVMHILRNVNDIAICKFDKKDVVRHKLVQDIVNAYQKYEEDKNNGRS